MRRSSILGLLLLTFCFAVPRTFAQDWRSYTADGASTKYSPLTQIDATNVHNLKVAWRWTSPDEAIRRGKPDLKTFVNEATPLVINGVLYTSTSMSQVAISPIAFERVRNRTEVLLKPKCSVVRCSVFSV